MLPSTPISEVRDILDAHPLPGQVRALIRELLAERERATDLLRDVRRGTADYAAEAIQFGDQLRQDTIADQREAGLDEHDARCAGAWSEVGALRQALRTIAEEHGKYDRPLVWAAGTGTAARASR